MWEYVGSLAIYPAMSNLQVSPQARKALVIQQDPVRVSKEVNSELKSYLAKVKVDSEKPVAKEDHHH